MRLALSILILFAAMHAHGNALSNAVAAWTSGPYIAVLGDSIAEGYRSDASGYQSWIAGGPGGPETANVASLVNSYAGVTGTNFGYPGDRWFNTRTQRLDYALQLRPKYAFFHAGVNDVDAGNGSLANVLSEMEAVRLKCAQSNVVMIVDEIFPDSNFNDTKAGTIRSWNASLRAWAVTNGVHVSSNWATMGQLRVSTGELDDLKTEYSQDGVHLTDAGNRQFATNILATLTALAGAHYVDFDTGADTNSGAAAFPWKHSIGDAAATGVAGVTPLAPGETVYFKGGVTYRGQITVPTSGTAGNYISFDGNSAGTWGTGKAIMDGTVPISLSWTPCANADDCWTNANWGEIYYSDIPATLSNTPFQSILVDGTSILPLSQIPDPTNRIIIDQTETWLTPSAMAETTTTDTVSLTNANADYFVGSWVGKFLTANEAKFYPIIGFDPATDRITNSGTGTPAASPKYTLFNHPFYISQPGEYAIRTNENRIYYWPIGSDDPSTHNYFASVKASAFVSVGKSFNTFNNFLIQGYFGKVDATGEQGLAIDTDSTTTTSSNYFFVNNKIRFNRSMDRDWQLELRRSNATITNNFLHDTYGGGFVSGGNGMFVWGNTISNITGTAGYINTATNGLCISNKFLMVIGTHAQGVSIYGNDVNNFCVGVIFANNIVQNPGGLLTHQYSTNTMVINNLFDALGTTGAIDHWTGVQGAWYVGNTMIGNSAHNILHLAADNSHKVYNNIIDGGGVQPSTMPSCISGHNLYVGLASTWGQSESDFGPGDVLQTNLSLVFVNPTTRDWRLVADSAAIGIGTNTTAIFWDGSGVANDIVNATRSVPFDAGAYEYQGSRTLTTTTLTVQGQAVFGP